MSISIDFNVNLLSNKNLKYNSTQTDQKYVTPDRLDTSMSGQKDLQPWPYVWSTLKYSR